MFLTRICSLTLLVLLCSVSPPITAHAQAPTRVLAGTKFSSGALAFSPDRKLMAVLGADRKGNCVANLRDLKTGKVRRTIKFPKDSYSATNDALAFSPDGKTLATGHHGQQFSGNIKLWDVKTGRLKRKLIEGYFVSLDDSSGFRGIGPVHSLAFSPDGSTIAAGIVYDGEESLGGEVALIDINTRKVKRRMKIPNRAVESLAYSPGGKLIAVATADGIIRLCSAKSGKVIHAIPGQKHEIKALAFTRDSKYLLSLSGNQTLKFWNVATGKLNRTSTNIGGKSNFEPDQIAFSNDARTLAISGEKSPITLVHVDY